MQSFGPEEKRRRVRQDISDYDSSDKDKHICLLNFAKIERLRTSETAWRPTPLRLALLRHLNREHNVRPRVYRPFYSFFRYPVIEQFYQIDSGEHRYKLVQRGDFYDSDGAEGEDQEAKGVNFYEVALDGAEGRGGGGAKTTPGFRGNNCEVSFCLILLRI